MDLVGLRAREVRGKLHREILHEIGVASRLLGLEEGVGERFASEVHTGGVIGVPNNKEVNKVLIGSRNSETIRVICAKGFRRWRSRTSLSS